MRSDAIRPRRRLASVGPVAGAKPEATSRVGPALAAAGLRPSKSRGQNFLTQGAVADRIVEAAALAAGDEVIEIGPGLGILTERILERGVRRLTLVELDHRLAARLASIYSGDTRVRIIESDFLEVDLAALAERLPVKVIGNLPFSSAGAIFRKLCGDHRMISAAVLMFQREVGERLRAAPGDPAYSALSVFAALYFEIDLHFRVAAGSFHPKPRVDAEVLRFRPLARLPFETSEEAQVLDVVRASFAARRKTIRNSLLQATKMGPRRIAEILAAARIDPGARAESLSVGDFVSLARAIAKAPASDHVTGA